MRAVLARPRHAARRVRRPAAAEPGARSGIGFDAHRLVAGRPMRIGGVAFPDEPLGPAGPLRRRRGAPRRSSTRCSARRHWATSAPSSRRAPRPGPAPTPADLRDAAPSRRLPTSGWRPTSGRPGGRGRASRDRAAARRDRGRASPGCSAIEAGAVVGQGHHHATASASRRGRDRRLGGGRGRAGQVSDWIGGRRPVAEALAAGRPARRLLLSASAPGRRPSCAPSPMRPAASSCPTDRVPADQLTRLAGFDGHQGVLLEVEERRWADVDEMLARAAQAGHDAVRARARAPPGPDELRHAAAVGGGRRRRRRGLPRAGRRPAERGRGQGERRRERASACWPGCRPSARRSTSSSWPGCGSRRPTRRRRHRPGRAT